MLFLFLKSRIKKRNKIYVTCSYLKKKKEKEKKKKSAHSCF